MIKSRKSEEKKTEWSEVAHYSLEFNAYWKDWELLVVEDNVLYRLHEDKSSFGSAYQIFFA